jgi:predicted MFS family arabinose efflux permease
LLLARAVSGFIGGYLGWRAVFVLAAVLDVVLLAIVLLYLPKSTNLTNVRYRDLMRSLWLLLKQEPSLRAFSATGFLMFAAFSALWSSLALLLAAPPYGFGPAAIGAFGLIAIAGIAISPKIGAMVDRVGSSHMVFAGALFVVLAFLLIAASGRSLAWLVVGILFLDLGNRAGLVANQARIYALRADARSRLNTIFMVSFFLGGAAGSALGGYSAHHGGWIGLAALGVALALCAAVVNVLALREPRPSGAPSQT